MRLFFVFKNDSQALILFQNWQIGILAYWLILYYVYNALL